MFTVAGRDKLILTRVPWPIPEKFFNKMYSNWVLNRLGMYSISITD